MISKRNRRSTQPQENLKQFSLNNSKGVDESKPITDNDTVQYMENLKVNPDGSLSLREPLSTCAVFEGLNYTRDVNGDGKPDGRETLKIVKAFPIRDFDHIVIVYYETTSGSDIIDYGYTCGIYNPYKRNDAFKGYVQSVVRHTPYNSTVPIDTVTDKIMGYLDLGMSKYLDLSNVEFIRTNTSVILGNCLASSAKFAGLVDSEVSPIAKPLPRYIQVYYEPDSVGGGSGKYVFEIKNPEMNTLNDADGELTLTVNTTLDNPYAVSDIYNSSLCNIKGILPYFYTDSKLNLNADSSDLSVKKLIQNTDSARFRPALSINAFNANAFKPPAYLKALGTFPITLSQPFSVSFASSDENVCTVHNNDNGSATVTAINGGTATITATASATVTGGGSTEVITYTATCSVYATPDFDQVYITDLDGNAVDSCTASAKGTSYRVYITTSSTFDTLPNVNLNISTEKSNTDDVSISFVGRPFVKDAKSYYRVFTLKSNSTYAKKSILNVTCTTYFGKVLKTSEVLFISRNDSSSQNPEPMSASNNPTVTSNTVVEPISNITETNEFFRLSPIHLDFNSYGTARIKAILMENATTTIAAVWKKLSSDGTFEAVPVTGEKTVLIREPVEVLNKTSEVESNENNSIEYVSTPYRLLTDMSEYDKVSKRIDVLKLNTFEDLATAYRFQIIAYKQLAFDDPAYDKEGGSTQFGIGMVLDVADYTPNLTQRWEFADYDAGNSVLGKKLLYKNSIYSYGDASFKNSIFKSDAGSLITPYLNSIDSTSIGTSNVTTIIPWRDYLYIATESHAALAIPADNGFYVKNVNTFIGIPKSDSECCKTTLNGIIFKSGNKVFIGYPNLYSESDVVLNYSEISKPVASVLENIVYDKCYAVNTTEQYALMLVKNSSSRDVNDGYTYVLIYNYVNKIWSVSKYPRPFESAYAHADGTIHVYYRTAVGESYPSSYLIEASLDGDVEECYGDELYGKLSDGSYGNFTIPIPFKWDTGQKTDSISNTKQFVESKIMFATLDERDKFPFTTHIAIDGTPRIVTTDISTDAPFWKTADSFGVVGTSFSFGGVETPASGAFNTLRQLVLRYSGKGKSIRHVIEGQSMHDFKMYETYVRYKNLNVK